MSLFSVEFRNRVCQSLLERASSDERLTAAAIVGSLAREQADRWSDIDLTMSVRQHASLRSVLDDFSAFLSTHFEGVPLFDLQWGTTHYRVHLVRGGLQVDLSVADVAHFAALGPSFRLIFGAANGRPEIPTAQQPAEIFGYGVHHVMRANACIERYRQAEAAYWIGSARDCALRLACRRRGLPADFGRGYDDLPRALLRAAEGSLPASFDVRALRVSLTRTIALLIDEGDEAISIVRAVEADLRLLASHALENA